MLTRRRNRDILFVFTCYFIRLGPGSMLFIFVSIRVLLRYLVNEQIVCIAYVFYSRPLLIPRSLSIMLVTLSRCNSRIDPPSEPQSPATHRAFTSTSTADFLLTTPYSLSPPIPAVFWTLKPTVVTAPSDSLFFSSLSSQ